MNSAPIIVLVAYAALVILLSIGKFDAHSGLMPAQSHNQTSANLSIVVSGAQWGIIILIWQVFLMHHT